MDTNVAHRRRLFVALKLVSMKLRSNISASFTSLSTATATSTAIDTGTRQQGSRAVRCFGVKDSGSGQ
jgi:hypothetical protein